MDYTHEVCIICEKRFVDKEFDFHWTSTVIEDELRDLRVFMCKILSVPASCFEYSGFPVCKDCTITRIKDLLQVHNELIALRISYTSLKEKLLEDIVTVYFSRNVKLDQFNPEKTRLKERILQKWQNYADFSLPVEDDEPNDEEEIDCFPGEIKEELNEAPVYEEEVLKDDLSEVEEDYSPAISPKSMSEEDYLHNDTLEDNSNNKCLPRKSPRKRKAKSRRNYYYEDSNTSSNIIRNCGETDEYYNDATDFDESIKDKCTRRPKHNPVSKMKKKKGKRIRKSHKCPQCSKIVKGGTEGLKVHIRVHTGERPFACPECSQAFKQHANLTTHRKLKHGFDGKQITAEGRNEVISRRRYYNCNLCSSEIRSKGLYLRHLKELHVGKEIQEDESFWFYYCDVEDCLVSCTDQDNLKKHFIESHKELLGPGYSEFPRCEVCERIFAMQENLEIHKNCHSSGDRNEYQSLFGCQYCHEIFKNENERNEHVPRHKLTCDISRIFCHMCDLCGRTYKDLTTLLTHQKKSHKVNSKNIQNPSSSKCDKIVNHFMNYECWFCLSWYKNKSFFLRHLKSVHMDEEVKYGDSFWFYNCDVKECVAACANADNLLKHFQTNHADLSQEGRFPQCFICQRAFVLQENLELHLNCHSEDLGDKLKFSCEYCPDLFLSASERNKHQTEHKILFDPSEFSYACDICNKGFKRYSIFYRHKRVVHKGITNVTSTSQKKHPERNSLQCSVCTFKASSLTNIQLHTEKIHPEVGTPIKLLRHGCKFCEKRFYSTRERHQHCIRYHRSEYLMGKSFCISCFNTFDTEEEMNTHFKEKHSDLICPVEACGKRFPSKTNIWRHMNTHNNEKPFICEYCPEGFAQEAALQYHINKKHTFHRSFFCKLCPDNPGYYERVSFYKHVEKEHSTYTVKEILITKYPKRKYNF